MLMLVATAWILALAGTVWRNHQKIKKHQKHIKPYSDGKRQKEETKSGEEAQQKEGKRSKY